MIRRINQPRTVAIERTLLGALTRSRTWPGETDPPLPTPELGTRDVALLLGRGSRASPTVRRLLSRACRSFVTEPAPYQSDALAGCPVTALIEIAPGIGWEEGTLLDVRGALPQTIVTAAIGRPVGALIDHPDIDGSAIMREAGPGRGLVSIEPEIVHLPIPRGPSAALRRSRLILAARRAETPSNLVVKWSASVSALGFLASAHMTRSAVGMMDHMGSSFWVTVALLCLTLITGVGMAYLAIDAWTGDLLTEIVTRNRGQNERRAHDRQAIMLLAEFKRRGFGVIGERE